MDGRDAPAAPSSSACLHGIRTCPPYDRLVNLWRVMSWLLAVGLAILGVVAWVAVVRMTSDIRNADGAFAARRLRLLHAPAGRRPRDPFGVEDVGTPTVLLVFAERCRQCWRLTTELASVAETAGSQLLVLTSDIDDPSARRARRDGLRAIVAYDADGLLYEKRRRRSSR